MPEWEVFLSPHTDDESLAMAGAISRARLAGRKTCVILVTDNLPSARQRREFAMHEDLENIRRVEFQNALTILQVDEMRMWEIEEEEMKHRPIDVLWDIQTRLQTLRMQLELVHVHTVCGLDDVHVDAGFGSIAHGLCAQAATQFANDHPSVQVSLHGIYVYSKRASCRQDCGMLHLRRDTLSDMERELKTLALRCYYPGPDCIGYGYKSVPELFDNAMADPNEYVIEITRNIPVCVYETRP